MCTKQDNLSLVIVLQMRMNELMNEWVNEWIKWAIGLFSWISKVFLDFFPNCNINVFFFKWNELDSVICTYWNSSVEFLRGNILITDFIFIWFFICWKAHLQGKLKISFSVLFLKNNFPILQNLSGWSGKLVLPIYEIYCFTLRMLFFLVFTEK